MAPTASIHSVHDDAKLLQEALANVHVQQGQLRRCLAQDHIMDALKAASTMLAELRTSQLSPKQYYELYMAVFDALRHLSSYLYDAHVSGRHHLADLYELVQYAGNIVPRLYLMITVGTVYMSIPGAPVKEIMKDMMEMTRGVQHPTRGLFLRHYLSGMTRDHLPVGDDPGPSGNLYDSIGFVLTNFIEMNKLWVRLQHSGLSRDRERRELERRELRILVGTNLVRLSQLDGVDLELYQRVILPSILEQVVNCKDVIAQEYLMEVVIQVFTSDFHLRTLTPFLSATAQLHPKVPIKSIVIALLDRLAAYAAKEAESEPADERRRQEERAKRELGREIQRQKERRRRVLERESAEEEEDPEGQARALGGAEDEETEGWGAAVHAVPPGLAAQPDLDEGDGTIDGHEVRPVGKDGEVRKYRGIPEDVKLFEVFWEQVVSLIKARPDLSIQDITALLVSLANLSLSCYPAQLTYIDQVLSFATYQCAAHADSPDLHHPTTTAHLLALLLAPIASYASALTLLALPSYDQLLHAQPYATRRSLAHAVVASVLKNETVIDAPEDVKGVLALCHVLVRDQKDRPAGARPPFPHAAASGTSEAHLLAQQQQTRDRGALFGAGGYGAGGYRQGQGQGFDREEMAEEQGWIARMVHLFRADDLQRQFALLQTARREFTEGGERIRWTFPPLIVAAIKLARRYKQLQSSRRSLPPDEWDARVSHLFKFIHQCTSILYNKVEASDVCLRLYLLALAAADETGHEELAYEFAVQAFTIYEESISESRAQLQAITAIVGALQLARVFGDDNYDTLITKAALHGAKLLKKGQQATAVALASHLWWQMDLPGREPGDDEKPPYRDGKRVLECLQKSLRIATSSIDELTSVQLYCDALDQYLYYFERGVESISAKHINSLVELISSNLDTLPTPPSAPSPNPSHAAPHPAYAPSTLGGATSGLIEGVNTPEAVVRHFVNSLRFIAGRKDGRNEHTTEEIMRLYADVEVQGTLLKYGAQVQQQQHQQQQQIGR
ncbi:retromer subunit VPS35 [Rhodotorula paludigena]|uniref:retromer subunit VPS35 n=1 Tax=Rhodotorula paludigena TaxID=86838 RepID=UPI00316DA130